MCRLNYCSSIQPVVKSRWLRRTNPLIFKEISHGRTRQEPQQHQWWQRRKGQGPAGGPGPDRKAVRQGHHHALGRGRGDRGHPGRLHRLLGAGHCAGRRWSAPGACRRNLRSGVIRQDHADAAGDCRNAKAGRPMRLCGRRARAGRAVRPKAGREPARPADLPARHR